MCAFNEERTILRAVRDIFSVQYPCEMELVVVDDGSTDATSILLSQVNDPRLVLHRHSRNQGKGAALRTAANLATGSFILPFDADLEYAAEDIPKVLAPALSKRCEVVYGVRLFGYNTVYQSYRYAVGNHFLTRIANILFDAYLSDLHTCLKLVPLGRFRSLNLKETGFGLDTELTASLLRQGIRPFEVPVSYYGRTHADGKKITWRDALACLRILVQVRLRRKSQLTVSSVPAEREAVTWTSPDPAHNGVNHVASLVMHADGEGTGARAAN